MMASRRNLAGSAIVTSLEAIIETALLIAAPYPVWRLLCFPPFRRGRASKARILAGVLLVYIAIVGIVAVTEPGGLRYLVGFAAVVALFLWYRSRPSYGRRRNLPPGRLTLLPIGPARDLHEYERQAATYGPVFKTGASLPLVTLRPMVCIVGHRLGLDLLSNHEESLAITPVFPLSRFLPAGFLRNMAPTDHQLYAKRFHAAFAAAPAESFADDIANAIRDALARMSADGARGPGGGVDPRAYFRSMMFEILAQVFFGIKRDSAALARMKQLYDTLDMPTLTSRSPVRRVEPTLTALMEFLREQATLAPSAEDAALGHPVCVLGELAREDPRALDDRTVLGNLIQMVESGGADVAGVLTWATYLLSHNRGWIARLREIPDQPYLTSGSLADRVISETLRLEQSEYLYRAANRDIEFQGYVIPRGWMIRICIREGHRDPDMFAEPEIFDPDRFLDGPLPISLYAPFGLFRHRCVGAQLTQAVGRILVHVLAT